MGDFWAGSLIGFFAGIAASILANYIWDLKTRLRAYKMAGRLIGTWEAYDIHGRTVDPTPMKGAGLTVVSSKPHWWSANSGVLDVRAKDIDAATGHTRGHDGHIVFDSASPWRATRIYRYADSNEISEQQLVVGEDFNIVYVFPVPAVATLGDVYGKHAWRRKS
jgi:hypothetical protein